MSSSISDVIRTESNQSNWLPCPPRRICNSDVSISRRINGEVFVYLSAAILKRSGLEPRNQYGFRIVPDNIMTAFSELGKTGKTEAIYQTPRRLFIMQRETWGGNDTDWNGKRLAIVWEANGSHYRNGKFRVYWQIGYPRVSRAGSPYPQQIVTPDHVQTADGLIVLDLPTGLFEQIQ